MRVGLRIDVDTFRGTRIGVPALCRVLQKHKVQATFFFSVGPDNMGRHLWRLIRPRFLWKMLRTNAAGLYGWDILLCGAFWPGPRIGERLRDVIRATAADHEAGLHAWDHQFWQAHIDDMTAEDIHAAVRRGYDALAGIIGRTPDAHASPSWKCNDLVLAATAGVPFRYGSDCRGRSVFGPILNGQPSSRLQVPVTLPTYDELVGPGGIPLAGYNDHMLGLIEKQKTAVLCIHAEVEGISRLQMFSDFLSKAAAKGLELVPLGRLLEDRADSPSCRIAPQEIPGREGWVAVQQDHDKRPGSKES